ncbi:Predicted ABC-type ATPase, partial [Azotobacter beijerinckii]
CLGGCTGHPISPKQRETIKSDIDKICNCSARLLAKAGLLGEVEKLSCWDGRLDFNGIAVNSYYASVVADFIRHKLLDARTSFTFETVMSSPDKVDFLRKAKAQWFRTYLYFVATEDPEINISRVANRVRAGGHPVPKEKIVSRYYRSLDLLAEAVQYTDRAYIFDNSGQDRIWLAEVTDGVELEFKGEWMPHWFKTALWDKFAADEEAIQE